LHNRLPDIGERDLSNRQGTAIARIPDNQVDIAAGERTEPTRKRAAVGQSDVDQTSASPTKVFLGCQRPVDPRRSDFQEIGFVPGIKIVEKRRRRARQFGGCIKVERFVTVGGCTPGIAGAAVAGAAVAGVADWERYGFAQDYPISMVPAFPGEAPCISPRGLPYYTPGAMPCY